MSERNYHIITATANPGLVNDATRLIDKEWPEFMLHDPVADLLADCYKKLPDYQFILIEGDSNEPLALGNSIPLDWQSDFDDLPDDGWDWALSKGIADFASGRQQRIQCALQIVVFGDNRGKGLSSLMVRAMKRIGAERNLNGLIAPVRPSKKCDYPLTPIDNYIKWTNEKGGPFDPWLRVHHNLGAKIIKPCHNAMRIPGTVAEWSDWTKMRFPESGRYVIPGALVPIEIDIEADTGLYIEPNVWMHHPKE